MTNEKKANVFIEFIIQALYHFAMTIVGAGITASIIQLILKVIK